MLPLYGVGSGGRLVGLRVRGTVQGGSNAGGFGIRFRGQGVSTTAPKRGRLLSHDVSQFPACQPDRRRRRGCGDLRLRRARPDQADGLHGARIRPAQGLQGSLREGREGRRTGVRSRLDRRRYGQAAGGNKKNKSNVILVGEAGVGKTAIVEGMAEKILKRQCPDLLLHKKILSLDLTSVLAGTIYRGQMEEKLKKILDQLSSSGNHYILFIDEIHNIIGAGGGSDGGGLDFANIMKPALSRGDMSCVGATTKEEYERFFKKDAALNRRFEKIDIKEPTKEETFELIKVAKKSYEKFHQVEYKEDVLSKIIDLCDIYLTNKKFPDKAFDILDESGARTKKINFVRPQKAKNMEDKLMNSEFQESPQHAKFQKAYSKIIEKWGKSLENKVFPVDIDVIYDIFAYKLNTSKENVRKGNNIPLSGKIGF